MVKLAAGTLPSLPGQTWNRAMTPSRGRKPQDRVPRRAQGQGASRLLQEEGSHWEEPEHGASLC